MPSHSNSPPDSRPPGGTARLPGTRTPRRVQWAAAVDQDALAGPIRSRHREEEENAWGHALDEAGLDPAAFQTLAHALERHRSSSASPHANPDERPLHSATTPSFPATPSTDVSSVPTSPTLSVNDLGLPGEVFVDSNERAGLPAPFRDSATATPSDVLPESEAQAARVVRAHSRRRSIFTSRLHRRKPKASGSDDVEATADSTPPRTMRAKGGVLAALLTLYDQSDATSLSDTPTSIDTPIPHSPEHPHSSPHGHYNNFSLGRSLASPTHSLASLASTSSKRISDASKHFGLGFKESRPAKERNAAGVWGSLIASTGNITGAAAPVPSTVVPDVKRPGYHLSRYSLDSNIQTPRPRLHTVGTIPRPRSMHFETQPGTSSTHSPPTDSSSPTDSPLGPLPAPTRPWTEQDKPKWTEVLKDLPKRGWASLPGTAPGTPKSGTDSEGWEEKEGWYSDADARAQEHDEREEREYREERRRERKRHRRKAEIFITRHISTLLSRQTFILKLARAMMMFGGPTHRLQPQIQSTARVLEISLSCMYLPDVMLISFDDDVTSTSSVKLIRQGSTLDLGKLQDAHDVYWKVIHDEISVKEASTALDTLMLTKPLYSAPKLIFFGGMASASICSVSFKGSFIDSLISIPLGALLVAVQLLSVRNELYSNVFEITIATLLSFLSAALAQTHHFCYSAVASSSVVLILPGFIVLCGSLELSSRNIVSGAVRLCYALIYSLFLGFGLAIGAEAYEKMTGNEIVGPEDYSCMESHSNQPWYQSTPSLWWAFLTVPAYSLFLSLRNHAPWDRKELVILILISCIGWVTNHFTGTKFPNQSDISAAVGAFAVGLIANIYGRLFNGNAFVVMITGILFQLPSGLGNGGLLHFADQQTSGSSNSYLSGFQVALQLISVSIGLTVGLGISLVIIFPVQSRRRQSGVFSL
ncbi:DUF1212-domain-containing protein [Artomyces pyxidatus]|uniref:DUF1212-domain-containing protein n=1 Tax=Artomyces pyxidatus TaxID=48021 RepID=A0ACB8TAA3_9AGAM|nr:DUF1212-domain-containing protein [Artomyces pyxidatus]